MWKKRVFWKNYCRGDYRSESFSASKLIKLLLDSNVIIPVAGHGKGKYRF